MGIKSAIRKAITENTKYNAKKVWSIDVSDGWYEGEYYMIIEVGLTKKKRKKKK